MSFVYCGFYINSFELLIASFVSKLINIIITAIMTYLQDI